MVSLLLSFFLVNWIYYLGRCETSGASTEAPVTVPQFLEQNLTVNKDFSLSLVSNNLPVENESKLREGFAKKIEKGTFYASNSGNIAAFNLG